MGSRQTDVDTLVLSCLREGNKALTSTARPVLDVFIEE